MEATRSVAQRRRAEEDAEEDRIEEEARQQRLAEEEAARQAEEARLKVGQAHGASVMYLWHWGHSHPVSCLLCTQQSKHKVIPSNLAKDETCCCVSIARIAPPQAHA